MTVHGLTPLNRFLRYVTMPDDRSQCWLWTGALRARGWGGFRIHSGVDGAMSVGRASWILHRGPVPAGLHVLHHCDNGLCVNPQHLYVGTPADNARDRVVRARALWPNARHTTPTKSGTRAHIRIAGALYRKHFPKGTARAVIAEWIRQTRERVTATS